MFYIFALFSVFVNNKSLYQSFGFVKEQPIMIGFLLFSDALAPMDAVVKLLMNVLSRKFEFEAGMLSLNSGSADKVTNYPFSLQMPSRRVLDSLMSSRPPCLSCRSRT
jgi:STE24 endopeptidase